MFAWPATNVRMFYNAKCLCGEQTDLGSYEVLSLNSDIPIPQLPGGWTVVNGTAWCPAHRFVIEVTDRITASEVLARQQAGR